MEPGKKFTDLFINRPVLATVISLVIFIIGIRAVFDLPVRQFPKLENTLITIITNYPGASAQLMQGFITAPIEKEIASAGGIDYLNSTSMEGTSLIRAYIKLNYPPNEAFTNILSKVSEVRGDLPTAADEPIIQKSTGETVSLMYIGFNSKHMSSEQITDYISRVVQPKLETISGVSQAQILGGSRFAMRIWLNPQKMAAFGVTPNEVEKAILANNFQTAAGQTKGEYVAIPINADTDLQTTQGFRDLIIKENKGALVRLRDVANVELGAENYDYSVIFNGKKAIFIGISATPDANPLTVIDAVKKVLPEVETSFPPSLHAKIVYDATKYIRSSIYEVIRTIIEAAIIVIVVIFLFLGSFRAVTIPMVTIPLSLIGVFGLMLALGYSINLLTLLALVLAIGMVVDDAIVVIENIYRHIEEGMAPYQAAIRGAREIALPVISMTITLAAVYAPIGFMGGLTGALFKEFAFTLASAVIISGIIALTLSPMMCAKFLNTEISKHRLVHAIDQTFLRLKNFYSRLLHGALNFKPVVILFAFVVLLSCLFLYLNTSTALAPNEDQGVVFGIGQGPQTATLNYMQTFTNEFTKFYKKVPAVNDFFILNGFDGTNMALTGAILKPWNERKLSQNQVSAQLQNEMNSIPGLLVNLFPLPPLPSSGSPFPVDFVITSTASFQVIYPLEQKLLELAKKSGLFLYIDGTLKFNQPEVRLTVNRDKAAQLGITMQSIGNALATALGGNYINRFSMGQRSYEVIPQLGQRFRLNPRELEQIYVKTISGKLVPLSNIAEVKIVTQPNSLTTFQQLNSAELQGITAPGYTISQGLNFLEKQAKRIFPRDVTYNFAGQSRQFIQEGSKLIITFIFSIIIIFLVLAAQFESFRDPLVIMISVPMAICGALLPLNWFSGIKDFSTINIYTQIGLITLIGLISKHGILMVEFANKLQQYENLSPREAIEKAAAIRLRPILMTTFSIIFGVVPLLIATGAGAVSRFDMGLVIASGMAIGTLFTLFVIPTMYMLKTSRIWLFLLAAVVIGFVIYSLLYVIF